MAIKSVELINDYEINLRGDALQKIREKEDLLNYLSSDYEIEEDEDIVFIDLAEACEELKLDLKDYFNEYNVIRVIMDDGSESFITNLEIAPLWEWHEYCDEMVCNWFGDYLMLTAEDYEEVSGLIAIFDISSKDWIFSDIEAFVRGMIYAKEINKFIALYDVETKDYSEIGITIIDPEDSFSTRNITFEAIGKVDGDDNDETQDYKFNTEVDDSIFNDKNISGTVIDEETAILWNSREKCCHVRIRGQGYRYCFE